MTIDWGWLAATYAGWRITGLRAWSPYAWRQELTITVEAADWGEELSGSAAEQALRRAVAARAPRKLLRGIIALREHARELYSWPTLSRAEALAADLGCTAGEAQRVLEELQRLGLAASRDGLWWPTAEGALLADWLRGVAELPERLRGAEELERWSREHPAEADDGDDGGDASVTPAAGGRMST